MPLILTWLDVFLKDDMFQIFYVVLKRQAFLWRSYFLSSKKGSRTKEFISPGCQSMVYIINVLNQN